MPFCLLLAACAPAATLPTRTTNGTTTPHSGPTLPTKATQLLVFQQHKETVRTISWSSAGNLLASGANDGQVLLWDITGQVHRQKDEPGVVHAVSWSPDAQRLAVAFTNQVALLDAQTLTTQSRARHTHSGTVTSLAWSPQQPGTLVSAGLDKLAIVWNTQPLSPKVTFRKHAEGITAASWAADGQSIATSSLGGVIRIADWHVKSLR